MVKFIKTICMLAIIAGMCTFVFGFGSRQAGGIGMMLFLGGLFVFIGARLAE